MVPVAMLVPERYSSVLRSPFCYLPFDVAIPGAIEGGDLQLLAGALAPSAVMLEEKKGTLFF